VTAAGGSVLVTGGAGFLGSHTAERLLAAGRRVIVLDNFDTYYDPAIKHENLALALSSPDCRLARGDIRDEAVLDRVLGEERIDLVVHLAARAGVRGSIADPVLYSSVNLDGTTRLLEACRRHGVGRFLFGSSSSVYGNNEKVPFSEDDPVDHPISPYAATKKAGELLCHTYHHLFGMRVACLRFFTVYGPRQRPEMAIHKFAQLLADGREIEQFGDGSSARDYTYVTDVIDGILLAAERCRSFHVWNLGGSRTTTLAELVAKLASRLGVSPRVRERPMQPGDVDRTWADVSRARTELGWEPAVDIDRGLDLFVDWFVRRRAASGSRDTATGGGHA
jgi:UDP-glucuronate 4-epimerase